MVVIELDSILFHGMEDSDTYACLLMLTTKECGMGVVLPGPTMGFKCSYKDLERGLLNMMWPQQAQPQMHQQAQAHIKAQSLEAWWERFTWASHKKIKSIMGFLHYLHGLNKSLKYEMMHGGSSLDLNWAIV